MSDEVALLAAIRAHPDEDTPRLAYADWLDEHGNADRAEFIRAQIAIAQLPDDDPRRCELEITERRLLAKNVVEWAAPWPRFCGWEYAGDEPWRTLFRRGFLEEVDNLGIPESGDGISDALQEAKWEADFLIKMQDADGGFYYSVYPRDREYELDVLPENGDPQVVWPKNTATTAAAVAALVP